MCENECHKARTLALTKYETTIKDLLHNKLPLSSDQLNEYHKMAKNSSKSLFDEKAVGDIANEFKIDLIKKIK